ncbi:hypothetical protein T484DRAFT_1922600, partial [Baffinella frigidus]
TWSRKTTSHSTPRSRTRASAHDAAGSAADDRGWRRTCSRSRTPTRSRRRQSASRTPTISRRRPGWFRRIWFRAWFRRRGGWTRGRFTTLRSLGEVVGVEREEPSPGERAGTGGLDVIRKEARPLYRTSSGVRLCWELEEPKGPKEPGRARGRVSSGVPVYT